VPEENTQNAFCAVAEKRTSKIYKHSS